MKIFLDSAIVEDIKRFSSSGLVDGVTTNPTLILKSGRDQEEVTKEICSLVDGPVSAEGVGETAEQMIEDGRKFAKWAKNIVVKIPMTEEGLKAVKVLEEEGIKTNVTLVFSMTQALLAAKAGASYISPFVGRLDDISQNGMSLIEDIVDMLTTYEFETEVIVASVRHPEHVKQAAMVGADIATIPPKVFEQLFKHPLTDIGIDKFLQDYKKAAE
jgi:transaldolase